MLSGAAGAEPALAAHRVIELGHLTDLVEADLDEYELRDPVARRPCERLRAIGVEQQHTQLAAVARIDEPRGVDERDSVPGGQTEAANALGLPGWSRMVDVVMPQAFKLSLPATVGFLVQLLKGTSLAAIVGFIELTRAGTIVSNQIYKPLLVFGVVGALYCVMCWPLSLWGRRLEQRMAAGAAR